MASQIIDTGQDFYNKEQFSEIHVFNFSFPEIKKTEDISTWINKFVKYRNDNRFLCQSPEKTVISGHGDCRDFSVLYMNILYINFGIKSDLCIVDTNEVRKIEKGGGMDHAIIRLTEGTLIEPQTGQNVFYTVKFSYSFDDIFNK
jgi:hypothetical protein